MPKCWRWRVFSRLFFRVFVSFLFFFHVIFLQHLQVDLFCNGLNRILMDRLPQPTPLTALSTSLSPTLSLCLRGCRTHVSFAFNNNNKLCQIVVFFPFAVCLKFHSCCRVSIPCVSFHTSPFVSLWLRCVSFDVLQLLVFVFINFFNVFSHFYTFAPLSLACSPTLPHMLIKCANLISRAAKITFKFIFFLHSHFTSHHVTARNAMPSNVSSLMLCDFYSQQLLLFLHFYSSHKVFNIIYCETLWGTETQNFYSW